MPSEISFMFVAMSCPRKRCESERGYTKILFSTFKAKLFGKGIVLGTSDRPNVNWNRCHLMLYYSPRRSDNFSQSSPPMCQHPSWWTYLGDRGCSRQYDPCKILEYSPRNNITRPPSFVDPRSCEERHQGLPYTGKHAGLFQNLNTRS